MQRDERYKNVKNLIEAGKITAFRQIFTSKALPKTVLAQDLGMHHQTFNKLLKTPQRFTYENAFHIASLLEIDKKAVVDLIYNQCIEDLKGKKRK
ncbi:hypothetical protein [Puia dinghuensis]|uniref:Uncharacterized protein n=1 Tax=Puia dinghuensis TaxID=1792502 RepID=A0A8J2UHR8_9BACT|nr:hypothetical protein [Puia dinghuensis]GGB19272.1 hypothetical protein GCM10011511_48680 [Puia dinghuensis]